MPAFLFQPLDVREPRRRWRAFPFSLLLHVLIATTASLVVARPVARALEEERPRLLVLGAPQKPRAVATERAGSARATRLRSRPPANPAPPPAQAPIGTPDVLPAPGDAFDETPAPCLTGCGDGSPADAGDTTAGAGGSGAGAGAGAVGPGPLPLGGELRPPRKLHNVLPVYPEAARRVGFGGVVVVQCVIDVTGLVVEARVLSGHPLLDNAALDAVRRWRYEPTRLNGSPVPVVMTVTVTFQARR